MSKIDDQITDLRKAAQVYRNLGKYAMEVVLLDAADTICELRGALQVASVDYRQLADENRKLRELMRDTYDCICEMYDYMDGGYAYEDVEADPAYGPILKRMRELGVEV